MATHASGDDEAGGASPAGGGRAAHRGRETTHEEDHDPPRLADRGSREDHDPPRRRGAGRGDAVPRHPDPGLREVHRGAAVLRDAVHHRAHLRDLPGEPPPRLGQGLRRHHGGAHPRRRRRSCGSSCTARSSCSRTRSPSSTSPRPTSSSGWTTTPRSATWPASSRSTPTPCATGSRSGSSASRSSSASRRSASTRRGRCPGGVNAPARPARAREDARRAARGAGDRPADDRAVEEDPRPLPERDLHLQQLPDHVRRPRGPRRVAAPLRRQPPLRRPRGPDGGRPGPPGGLRRRTSARRRWPTRT